MPPSKVRRTTRGSGPGRVSRFRGCSRWAAEPLSWLFGHRRPVVVDINTAIDAYSYQGGNRPERLRAVCADSPGAVDGLAAEISGLQEDLYALVRKRVGETGEGMSRAEIGQLAQEHLAASRPDIDAVGRDALLRYVIWIAYHDGWLRRGDHA